ncbi:TIGR01244 family sulfur transferase [Amphibiibacter pelophylacis]|uniref:TIGR01244 family sulfur transferase n=1 Tax=Amphibiibacter pelophylacis TaxID=1799477 RepID=A0ACC6P5H0_9BURK
MSAFSPTPLTRDLSVSPQLAPPDMAAAKAAGYASIINNRPDFEHGPDQPTHADMQAAAQAQGLEYRFLPVSGAHQTEAEIAAFAKLMAELPKPILAFCRSGGRCTRLFAQAQALD